MNGENLTLDLSNVIDGYEEEYDKIYVARPTISLNARTLIIPSKINGQALKQVNLNVLPSPDSRDKVGLSNFKEVIFEEGIEEISIMNIICDEATKISLPNSLKLIGEQVFSYWSSLKEVTIPEGVETIKYFAFADCTSLTKVNIPNTVTTIENSAFMKDFNNFPNSTKVTLNFENGLNESLDPEVYDYWGANTIIVEGVTIYNRTE